MKVGSLIRVSVLIILVLSGYQWLTAAYLTDIPVQVNQPNGTVINCLASGDEFHNWLHDADGYTIIQSPITGYYTYAIQTGDTVSASDFIVGITDPQIAGLTPGINISESEYQLRRAEAFPEPQTRNATTTGTINNIVIFIHFAGQSEFGQNISVYNGLFNGTTSSMKTYFGEVSYNQLVVNSFFYPSAVNDQVFSWMSPNPREYYLPYSTSNTNGYHNTSEWQSREHALLRSAVNAVSSQIPDNLNIDTNNDGKVDNVVFIVNGPTSAWGTLLWPHKWELSTGNNVYINNKRVYDYNLQIRDNVGTDNVGVLCHEFCHTLGFPDLYVYPDPNHLDLTPVGMWDVMAVTSRTPVHMSAYMKWKHGNWISQPPVISAQQTYTLNPLTSTTNNVYRINSPNSTNQYFIVEYRDVNGTFESALADMGGTSGVLVYRINTDGDGNAEGLPYEVYIYRPGGTNSSTGMIQNASYSTQSGRIEINETTNPTPFLHDGSDGGLQLYVMGPNESTIRFRIGPPPAKIHGHITTSSLPENIYIPDLLLTLRRTNTHEVVAQTRPYWSQAIEYDFYADTGSYYIECEIFNSSECKFAYPVLVPNGNITVEAGSWIQDITLPPVTLTFTPYNINLVRVSSNAANPYFKDIMTALQRIQTAVNGGYNGNSVTLDVLPGNYYWPQTNYQPTGSFSYTNTANSALSLAIRGAGNGAIIEPQCDDYYTFNISRTNISFQNIKFSRASNNWNYYLAFNGTNNSNYSFTGCLFGKNNTSLNYKSSTSFINQSGISLINCSISHNDNSDYGYGVLKFQSCSNVEIDNCSFSYNGSFMGGAAYISQSNNVHVRNSVFENNCSWAPESEIPAGTPGGAIYIASSTNMYITNNRFLHNTTTGTGGAVYLNAVSPIRIEGNLFRDNTLHHIGLINPQSDALGFDNCTFGTNDLISRNIIHSGFEESSDSPSDFIAISGDCAGTLNISNGVFIKGTCDGNNEKRIVRSFSPVNMNFTNCVFQTRDVDADFLNSSYPPQPATISVTYSLFDNEFTGVTLANHNTCNVSDMKLDSNYVPIWNQTIMSPCIDAGTGEKDIDGTPADIGAIPAATHAFWDYTFRKSSAETQPNNRSDTWHWVSYPVINSLTQGKKVSRSFFSELLGTHPISFEEDEPDLLQTIWWKESNTDHFIVWEENINDWSGIVDTHQLSSPQGYKIKLLPLGDPIPVNYPSVVLHHSGFPTSPTSPFTIHGSDVEHDQIYENWIGYFDTECQWPQDAFASIWNDIIFIKAKDWCLYRSNRNNNFSAIEGTMLPIKCGDMVVVATYSDHDDFQWETSNPVVPIEKEKATYFTYEEKPDYTPVEIALLGIDKTDLKEIALKLNGICKGAVVVKNDVEQLCAYLDINEKLTEGTVELIFYYESKSQPQELKSINVDRTQLSSNSIGGVSAYPVYHIAVTPNDLTDNSVPVLSLEQNYPNPFNPTTIIKYSLDEPGAVSLEIYNIKGQLVKKLIQGNADKGTHSVAWDGIDHVGNPCSSGVYFYKLRTNSKTLVRKMLMLK
ncbi:MAG: hypothetical protein CVU48_10335 [Candidatus Cloacimonetes bacterium HGW-Cloacimonetes-1]|jgi:M6 family metalloprotease-like protein|nr:MAG: hypothetical protein CVU48_10335 [Candidatus Cloacimonetes bacterium HGW-Cloacimonetes-1]